MQFEDCEDFSLNVPNWNEMIGWEPISAPHKFRQFAYQRSKYNVPQLIQIGNVTVHLRNTIIGGNRQALLRTQ